MRCTVVYNILTCSNKCGKTSFTRAIKKDASYIIQSPHVLLYCRDSLDFTFVVHHLLKSLVLLWPGRKAVVSAVGGTVLYRSVFSHRSEKELNAHK